MSAAPSLASPPLPATRAERLSAVLVAVRTLRPRRGTQGAEARIALHDMLIAAVECAMRLSGETFSSPLRGVPRTLEAAHAMWAGVVGEVGREMGVAWQCSALQGCPTHEHRRRAYRLWIDTAYAATRLFEDLTERRV